MKINLYSIRFLGVFLALAAAVLGVDVHAAETLPPDNKGTRATVEAFFADTPQMISIAKCESSFQQYTSKGATFTGAGGRYVGVFQIAKSHDATAKKLGFDIYTLAGNLSYAKYMYDHEGVRPWKGCVKGVALNKTTTTSANKSSTSTNTVRLTKNMGLGATGREVMELQKILNDAGFFISKSGPGSPGQETSTFSSKTADALKRFQCMKNIVCSGSASTTGYGYVGPTTRAALLKAAGKA